MDIIGEKINSARAEVAAAIVARDTTYIQDLARRQVDAGATYVDVNAAGPRRSQEPADLVWVVDAVQDVVEAPLCLDSANPEALWAALARVRATPIVNSISGESHRLEAVLPMVAAGEYPVIALAADDTGIGRTVERRMTVVRDMIAATRAAGVADERVLLDPLVLPLPGFHESGVVTLDVMRAVRAEFPAVRLCLALSNLSFSMPARGLINRVFLTLSLEAGLDAALIDPLDTQVMQEMAAAEMVLGRDPHCRRYTQAYRAGRFGFPGIGSTAGA